MNKIDCYFISLGADPIADTFCNIFLSMWQGKAIYKPLYKDGQNDFINDIHKRIKQFNTLVKEGKSKNFIFVLSDGKSNNISLKLDETANKEILDFITEYRFPAVYFRFNIKNQHDVIHPLGMMAKESDIPSLVLNFPEDFFQNSAQQNSGSVIKIMSKWLKEVEDIFNQVTR